MKKNYQKPEIVVLELAHCCNILAGSGNDQMYNLNGDNIDFENGELG